MWTYKTSSPEETFAFGRYLAKVLQDGHVLCLAGDLGAGKTLVTQGVADGLGVKDVVTSPTFTVLNVYQGETGAVYHFDLYRLEHTAELQDIGFAEYTSSGGIVIIEWPDRFLDNMPDEYLWIDIKSGESPNERLLVVKAQGAGYDKVCGELREIADSCFRYSHPSV